MLPSVASMILEWLLRLISSPEYRAKRTFTKHLAAIYYDVWGITNAFRIGKYRPEFNKVLWTIPAELKGSLIVYLLVLSLARTRAQVKIPILFGAVAQCTFTSDHLLALFIVGLIMAEFDLLWKAQESEGHQTWSHLLKTVQPYTFVLGLYLGSRPDGMDRAPGYISISYVLVHYFFVTPSQLADICPAIGSILVVSSINYSPMLQRPFTTPFAQYLGDISFSIYLIHFFILSNICKPWMPTAVALFDFLGPEHTTLSYGCGAALNMVRGLPFSN
jgi:peptidoglycan/LPS O-acetylase OafA/YrhL